MITFPDNSIPKTVEFRNEDFGVVAGIGGTIYTTSNAGSGWIKENSTTSENINKLAVIPKMNHFIAVGNNGIILRK